MKTDVAGENQISQMISHQLVLRLNFSKLVWKFGSNSQMFPFWQLISDFKNYLKLENALTIIPKVYKVIKYLHCEFTQNSSGYICGQFLVNVGIQMIDPIVVFNLWSHNNMTFWLNDDSGSTFWQHSLTLGIQKTFRPPPTSVSPDWIVDHPFLTRSRELVLRGGQTHTKNTVLQRKSWMWCFALPCLNKNPLTHAFCLRL